MIITKMKPKGNNIIISFNDGTSVSCQKDVLYSGVELYEGMEIDRDEVSQLLEMSMAETIRSKALSLISNTTISEAQLKNKLIKRKYPMDLIKHTIRFCKECDLIDDRRFAKIATLSLLRKNKSRRAIADYLRKAGISQRLIQKMMDRITDRRERVSLNRNIIKYYPLYINKKDPEKSILQYLISKGFMYDIATKRVKKYFEKMKMENKI